MVFDPGKKTPIREIAGLLLDAGSSEKEAFQLLSTAMYCEALERCRGNICRAARMLGHHRNTVTRRLSNLGLSRVPGDIRRAHSRQARLSLQKAPSRVQDAA